MESRLDKSKGVMGDAGTRNPITEVKRHRQERLGNREGDGWTETAEGRTVRRLPRVEPRLRKGACLGRATLFQTADCAFGYQIIEGYEVVRARHWCERFKPRERQQPETREEEKEQKGPGPV